MCGTCGCSQEDGVKYTKPGDESHHEHVHTHEHDHDGEEHSHPHTHGHTHEDGHEHHLHEGEHGNHHHHHEEDREIVLEQNILHKNDLLAERNRGFFEAKNIHAINLVSSPGSGKTSLLEKTITVHIIQK